MLKNVEGKLMTRITYCTEFSLFPWFFCGFSFTWFFPFPFWWFLKPSTSFPLDLDQLFSWYSEKVSWKETWIGIERKLWLLPRDRRWGLRPRQGLPAWLWVIGTNWSIGTFKSNQRCLELPERDLRWQKIKKI